MGQQKTVILRDRDIRSTQHPLKITRGPVCGTQASTRKRKLISTPTDCHTLQPTGCLLLRRIRRGDIQSVSKRVLDYHQRSVVAECLSSRQRWPSCEPSSVAHASREKTCERRPRSRVLHRRRPLWETSSARDGSGPAAVHSSFVCFRGSRPESRSTLCGHRPTEDGSDGEADDLSLNIQLRIRRHPIIRPRRHRSARECTVFVGIVLEPDVDVDAVGPGVNVLLLREITFRPLLIFV